VASSNTPLINPLVQERLDMFVTKPTHALLLSGPAGLGHYLAGQYVLQALKQHNKAVTTYLTPVEKQHIIIEQVRELRSQLKLRNIQDGTITRIVVIDSIDQMLEEAQNALLKMLEEPPQGVLFVLYSFNTSKLLPTVTSRCVSITLLPIKLAQAKSYFGDALVQSNYTLSGGYAELLLALQDQSDHPLVDDITLAKQVLSATTFERLAMIDALAKQKPQAERLIDALYKVCTAGLYKSTLKHAWLSRAKRLAVAKKRLHRNVQLKLVLDELFLGL
jgi:DNA polymerase-3 subunit delta'